MRKNCSRDEGEGASIDTGISNGKRCCLIQVACRSLCYNSALVPNLQGSTVSQWFHLHIAASIFFAEFLLPDGPFATLDLPARLGGGRCKNTVNESVARGTSTDCTAATVRSDMIHITPTVSSIWHKGVFCGRKLVLTSGSFNWLPRPLSCPPNGTCGDEGQSAAR